MKPVEYLLWSWLNSVCIAMGIIAVDKEMSDFHGFAVMAFLIFFLLFNSFSLVFFTYIYLKPDKHENNI